MHVLAAKQSELLTAAALVQVPGRSVKVTPLMDVAVMTPAPSGLQKQSPSLAFLRSPSLAMSPTSVPDVPNAVLLERAQLLRNVCIFRNIPQEDRLRLAGRCEHHTYPHGAKIMLQGDVGSHFYILLTGT
eukprot:5655179-Amphidinium_carterae.1